MNKRAKVKRKRSLYMVFIRHLFCFCLITIILVIGTIMLYTKLINAEIVRLPTYEQNKIEAVADKIRRGEDEATLFPDSCSFGVYNSEGNYLYGSFEGKERQDAWERWQNGDTGAFYNIFYRSIEKDDGNVVIVRYEVVAKFSNPTLRKLFPNAELLILSVALFLFLAQAALTARSFGHYLKKRLDSLTEIAMKVGREELDFDREHSDIREVDDVLGALFKMKEALQKSLKEQWKSQRMKQEQIAALAHDIKTPLTIIRGNAELMLETESIEELRDWDQEILENTAELEGYLEVLQNTIRVPEKIRPQTDITQTISQNLDYEEQFLVGPFLEDIKKKAYALGRIKKISVICSFPEDEFIIHGNIGFQEGLMRALENVISNGVDYCQEGGSIRILVEKITPGKYLRITVTDSGEGFSSETLRYGTELFYQADKSRTAKKHYGMGLYIARSVLEENGGTIELGNSNEGGGEVKMYVPCLSKEL